MLQQDTTVFQEVVVFWCFLAISQLAPALYIDLS